MDLPALTDKESAQTMFRLLQDAAMAKGLNLRLPPQEPTSCCGKGCNGCLIFWYDSKYEKARDLLKQKKIGEML